MTLDARDIRRANILGEAEKLIYGDREKTYGDPSKNLTTIAEFWSIYIRAAKKEGESLTAEDVCVMMTLLKAARLANQIDHKDSQVDACGYMALLERIQEFNKIPKAGSDRLEAIKNLHASVVKLSEGGNDEALSQIKMEYGCMNYSRTTGLCSIAHCVCSESYKQKCNNPK